MESLIEFAKSKEAHQQYPRLLKSLMSLDAMVGLKALKESIADDIRTVLAFSMLDNPQQKTMMTRARSAALKSKPKKKRKRRSLYNPSRAKRKSVAARNKQQEQENKNNPESENNTEETTLVEFLSKMGEAYAEEEDSDYKEEQEESIRSKRLQEIKLHTLLLGPPGTGKTTLAGKLANVWEALGLVNKKFIHITKGDLISKWQGAALEKMRDLVHEYSNGVIFIDEAYSMVGDSNDSYGNDMLHFIVHSMTNPECTTTFIMAGYAEMIKKHLFGANEGLSRRFHSVFVLEKPSAADMSQLYIQMCKSPKGWKCDVPSESVSALFQGQNGAKEFKNAGGDIEAFVLCTYKAHVNRFFPKPMTQRIIKEDMDRGLEMYLRNKNKKKQNQMCACASLYI